MRRQFWTDDELKLLHREYPHTRAQEIADKLGRPVKSVYAMAYKLRIGKTDEFNRTHWSGRIGTADFRGVDTRFKPGNKPWIAGKKMGAEWSARGRMAENQFRKGQVAHNWQPVGHVREVDGGYLQVKLLPKGRHTETYRFVHHLVWELHHGAIPPHHVVRFVDGNRHNTDPANLWLMDLRKHRELNSMHALPKEVRELYYLKGRITKAINAKGKP